MRQSYQIIVVMVIVQAITCSGIIHHLSTSEAPPKSSDRTFAKVTDGADNSPLEVKTLALKSETGAVGRRPSVLQPDHTPLSGENAQAKPLKYTNSKYNRGEPRPLYFDDLYDLQDDLINNVAPTTLVSTNKADADNVNKQINEEARNSNSVKHTDKSEITKRVKRDITYTQLRPTTPTHMDEIKIATVLPADETRLFSIKRVRPAIEFAIEKMNPMLARFNKTLVANFSDSNCDIADGINEAINFYVRREMDVLFGPCCDYAVAPCARQVCYIAYL